jgi:hypothetical protein
MNTVKIDTCENCKNVFDAKLFIDKNGEERFKRKCNFCIKRTNKIKRIKQKILNLQWQLFLMRDI